jgi:hypothetical protein
MVSEILWNGKIPLFAIDQPGFGSWSDFRTKTALESYVSGPRPKPMNTRRKLAVSRGVRQHSWLLNGDSRVEPMN